MNHTRLPAYFRGYTFDQWPSDFTSKVFTPEQIQIFDNVRKYLGVGTAETGDEGSDTKKGTIIFWMRENNIVPVFKLTSEQKERFKDSAYGKPENEKFLKQSIVARILAGDPSANATKQQVKQALKIEKQIQDTVGE